MRYIKKAASVVLIILLKGVILLAFRPRKRYVSERAKQEAFREPCVLISNHVRGFDGAVIFTLLTGKKITALVAKDMLDASPALNAFISYLPCIPIDREHPSLAWLRESRQRLKKGESIYLCPEGRCNFAKVVRPFKPGFVTLASSAGVRVVPVYHNGEYHYFFGRRFRMLIGEPIEMTPPPEGLREEEMEREAAAVHDVMNDLELQLNGFVRHE